MAFDLPLAQHAATVTLNLAVAIAAGAAMSALWLAPRASAWAASLRARLRPAGMASLALAILASVASLWLEAAAMAEVPLTEAAGAAWDMLTETHLGLAWMAGAGALLASACALAGSLRGARFLWLHLLALAAFLYTRSMVSHAAAGGDFSVAMLADWVHLILISVWVGEVFVAMIALAAPPGELLDNRGDCVAYIESLSTAATIALCGIIATGLLGAWHNVGSPAALTGNPYGTTLLAKLALVAAAVSLGGLNRFFVMPQLTTGLLANDPHALPALRRFVLVLRVEAAILLGVLVLAAMLSATSPPTAG